ncbi:MAG: UDP-glucose/GDP-mannose dehydrogenase family protein [Terracidiphilus sp.]
MNITSAQKMQVVPIAVIGSGYVGLVAAACLAEIGHEVICVDVDQARIKLLQSGGVPIFEEGLDALLARHRGNRLRFTGNLTEAVRFAQVIFIAVGTPQSLTGEADLSQVESAVLSICDSLDSYKVLVEKSTVPVLTSQWIARSLRLNGASTKNFDVVSNPEFLREGSAITDFLYPDRIVVGVDSERARKLLNEVYQPLIDGSYYQREDRVEGPADLSGGVFYIETSTNSAELIKQASNAFLALKVSFINAVSNLCERVNTDIEEVARGIGADKRIGSRFLRAGIGYGGSCFPKDIRALGKVADGVEYNFDLLKCIEQINEDQRANFLKKLRTALWSLKDKHIAILGLAFKHGTDDIRESPALSIIREILAEGSYVSIFDPAAMDKCQTILPESAQIRYASDEYDAVNDVHAMVILTEWPQFSNLDLARIHQTMRYPIVIDGRNLYSPASMSAAGFYYYSVGRQSVQPLPETDAFTQVNPGAMEIESLEPSMTV